MNLANNVFRNTVAGTERRVVQRCQDKYGNSQRCTRNVATYMASQGVHLLGLQECQDVGVFGKWMREASPAAFCTVAETVGGTQATSALVYDLAHTGPHDPIAMPHSAGPFGPQYSGPVRSVAAAYFPRKQLVFASVWLNHLDHGLPLARALKALLTRMLAANAGKPVQRMIVTMDSNDYTGSLKGFTYAVSGGAAAAAPLTLRLIGQPRTCCDDSAYKFPGDYILDTAAGHETVLASVPAPLASYMSDHLPVRLQRREHASSSKQTTAAAKKGAAAAKKAAAVASKKKATEWMAKQRAWTQKMRLRCKKKGRVYVARNNECRDKKRLGRPPNPHKAACVAAGRVWAAQTCRDRIRGNKRQGSGLG